MKKEKQEEARALRKRGFTIPEIERTIGCPRSSVSRWIKNIQIPALTLRKMQKRVQNRRIAHHSDQRGKPKEYLRKPSFNLKAKLTLEEQRLKDAFLMLYYGEGAKSSWSVMICNTDPKIIQLSLKVLRQIYRVNEKRLRCQIAILDIHNEEEKKDYWRKLTSINKFHKTIVKKYKAQRHKSNYNGTAYVSVADITLKELILKEIEELTDKLLKHP
ncbi:MAG: hypothetical protein JW708_08900 [Vallitaleaceae bacterium]|nr:hypothetical protein [Vallitaleaceae bacterium]